MTSIFSWTYTGIHWSNQCWCLYPLVHQFCGGYVHYSDQHLHNHVSKFLANSFLVNSSCLVKHLVPGMYMVVLLVLWLLAYVLRFLKHDMDLIDLSFLDCQFMLKICVFWFLILIFCFAGLFSCFISRVNSSGFNYKSTSDSPFLWKHFRGHDNSRIQKAEGILRRKH